eukprot:jgi/Tetstr1/454211/TSEL_041130.t1
MPSVEAILEYVVLNHRTAITNDPDCPIVISKAGNPRARRKTNTHPGAKKEDILRWADDNLEGFIQWRVAKDASRAVAVVPQPASRAVAAVPQPASRAVAVVPQPAPARRSASRPARMSPEPSQDSESGYDAPPDASDADEGESAPAPPSPVPPSPVPPPIQSPRATGSGATSALFAENPGIDKSSFYSWLVSLGFIKCDLKTGAFEILSVPAKGLHQRAAKEAGFDIGRRFTVEDSKRVFAKHHGLHKDLDIPKRGNLAALRQVSRLTGAELDRALMQMASDRLAGMSI